jgi:nucleotide-binding universal stress UspA family protein
MGYHARMADIERQVDQRLKQFAARCTEAGMAHTEVHVSGSPAEVIEREAQSCDLIVLARGATFRFTPQDDENDETLKKVLKIGTRPVVLVPESRSVGPVVIAYDGSHESIRALAAFQATGLGDQSPVHVMTVDSGGGDSVRHNERARQFLRYHKIEANSLMIESSHEPATVILEQLSLMGAGMLVMGACGQTRMREFLFGSVTRRMLAECPVPLFLFH